MSGIYFSDYLRGVGGRMKAFRVLSRKRFCRLRHLCDVLSLSVPICLPHCQNGDAENKCSLQTPLKMNEEHEQIMLAILCLRLRDLCSYCKTSH